MRKVKIAMVGVGDISGIYLKNITQVFSGLELVGVCDLIRERAEKAYAYGITKIYDTYDDILADDEVEIVLNLTRPYEHYAINKAALEAGKHVYCEKPLSASFEEGKVLSELASSKGLLMGGAPDTFLGAGIQTCRKLIDDGFIGDPVGAATFMICRGHESWHPNPEFYYQRGGGPMMDMGPYYITALVNLLGGVSAVTGVTKKTFPTRLITSEPKCGTVVEVECPTTVTGTLEFESGIIGTIFTTFDVHSIRQDRFEVYGSEGTLIVPDPNTFGGPVLLLRPEVGEFMEIPIMFGYNENSRGLGLADMAKAVESGRFTRTGVNQTLHVLEIMTAIEKSDSNHMPLTTKYERKPAMENNPVPGILD